MADTTYNFSGGDWIGAITNIPFQIASLYNSIDNQNYQRRQDEINRQMQYDFAQNSIKWRVNDAKQAGIHPLAALGVSPSSASPVYSSSEPVQAPNFKFGELFSAQIRKLDAEADKAEAEAKSISGQSGISADVSAPGSPGSQLSNNGSTIRAQGIENKKDVKNVLNETRQDKMTVAVYDHLQNIDDGSLKPNEKFDAIKSFFSNMAHYDSYPVFDRGVDLLIDDFKNLKPVQGYNNMHIFNKTIIDIWTKGTESFSNRVQRTRDFIRSWNLVKGG